MNFFAMHEFVRGTFGHAASRLRCPLIEAKLTSHMIGAFPFAALVAPFA